jgi:hypothetical protein
VAITSSHYQTGGLTPAAQRFRRSRLVQSATRARLSRISAIDVLRALMAAAGTRDTCSARADSYSRRPSALRCCCVSLRSVPHRIPVTQFSKTFFPVLQVSADWLEEVDLGCAMQPAIRLQSGPHTPV